MVVLIPQDDTDPDAKPLIFRGSAAAPANGGRCGSGDGLDHFGSGPGGAGGDGKDAGKDGAGCAALEASCVRKLNRNVLALLFAVAMMCYIDRTNLAFASVGASSFFGFGRRLWKAVADRR
jgi:hypothetical protein